VISARGNENHYTVRGRVLEKEGEKMKSEKKNNIKISSLPQCYARVGRLYDGEAVITCGHRKVTAEECISCGGERKNKLKLNGGDDE